MLQTQQLQLLATTNVGNSNAVSLPICYRYLLRDGAAARL